MNYRICVSCFIARWSLKFLLKCRQSMCNEAVIPISHLIYPSNYRHIHTKNDSCISPLLQLEPKIRKKLRAFKWCRTAKRRKEKIRDVNQIQHAPQGTRSFNHSINRTTFKGRRTHGQIRTQRQLTTKPAQ